MLHVASVILVELPQNNPSLGLGYVLPRLWDPGGVRSSPNVPRDRSICTTYGLPT